MSKVSRQVFETIGETYPDFEGLVRVCDSSVRAGDDIAITTARTRVGAEGIVASWDSASPLATLALMTAFEINNFFADGVKKHV